MLNVTISFEVKNSASPRGVNTMGLSSASEALLHGASGENILKGIRRLGVVLHKFI
jgi:hypothetical protein